MEEKLTTKQKLFLDTVLSGENIFLTGKAGTGKSFIVKKAMDVLKEENIKFVALAPTGVAANNVKGQTIHSLFALRPFGVLDFDACNYLRGDKREMIDKVEVIFIDEVSMLRPDVLDGINWTLRKNGCGSLSEKQIIFVGDLKQLPPVLDDNTRSVLLDRYDSCDFTGAEIYPELDITKIELDEVLRQSDNDFVDHLNIIRDGKKSEYFRQFVTENKKGIVLAPHNVTVDKYNRDGLSKIDSKEIKFKADIEGKISFNDVNVDPDIVVKNGAKIMYLVNSKNNNLFNGAIGEFLDRDGKYFIKIGNVEYSLERKEFTKKEYVYDSVSDSLKLRDVGWIRQYPIKLAYALSIHKSQGLTFDEVTIDLSRPCFSKGQMYVALSRVTTPGGLNIIV